jgi:large subunit ribosomal protein L16
LRIKTIKYSKGGCNFSLGTTALKALKAKRILPRQIEAARRVVSKKLTKKNKLLIRIFADTPITQKPKEVRMGKGKGSVAF